MAGIRKRHRPPKLIEGMIRAEERRRDKIIEEYYKILWPRAKHLAHNDDDFAMNFLSNVMVRFARSYPSRFMGKALDAQDPEIKRYMYKRLEWCHLDELISRGKDQFLIHAKADPEDFANYCAELTEDCIRGWKNPNKFFDFVDEILQKNVTPFQRAVYEGIVCLQMSHRELAQKLESNTNSTKSSLSQTKKKLKQIVKTDKLSSFQEISINNN